MPQPTEPVLQGPTETPSIAHHVDIGQFGKRGKAFEHVKYGWRKAIFTDRFQIVTGTLHIKDLDIISENVFGGCFHRGIPTAVQQQGVTLPQQSRCIRPHLQWGCIL